MDRSVTKPRLLDLYCGAGGAAMGYSRAGFDVTGVDNRPMPNYPFTFIQADAIGFLDRMVAGGTYDWLGPGLFDAVHASPPCQSHTTMSNRWRGVGGKVDDHLDLIPATRDRLIAWGLLYVIENVPGARAHLHNPITLSGGSFGLGVDRPRLFESNVLLMMTDRPHVTDPIGVYGKAHDGRRLYDRADGTIQYAASSIEQAKTAMGVDWHMTWRELAESIPPAYTEFIGRQLLDALERDAA